MPLPRLTPWFAAAVLALAGAGARADGLADLRGALARLPATTPLKAAIDAHDWRRSGEGRDVEEHQAGIAVGLEDGPRGLQPSYPRELLARLEAEARSAVKDKKAATPVEQTLGQLGIGELRSLACAAPALAREMDDATFKSESADTLDGKPARRLVFESGVESLPQRAREYAKEFKSVLTIWIAADGTPLASNRRIDLSGSAFVVIKFEQHSSQDRSYAVAGDRLVALRDDEKGTIKGAGENQSYRTERHLQVQP